MINAKCAALSRQLAAGNLSLKTYADALKGGKSGPAVVPNDPDNSTLVTVQQKGGHPGQFTPEEIDRDREVDRSGRAGNGQHLWPRASRNASINRRRQDLGRSVGDLHGEMHHVPHQLAGWQLVAEDLCTTR